MSWRGAMTFPFPAKFGQYKDDHRRRRCGIRVSLTMLKNLSEFLMWKSVKKINYFLVNISVSQFLKHINQSPHAEPKEGLHTQCITENDPGSVVRHQPKKIRESHAVSDPRGGAIDGRPLSILTNYFIFMRFSTNIWPNNRLVHPLGLTPAPPLRNPSLPWN